MKYVLIFAVALVLSPIAASAQSIVMPSSSIDLNSIFEQENAIRIQAGLPALHVSAPLCAASADRTRDMITRQYFSHVAPDGTRVWDTFATYGYQYLFAGENLAEGYDDASSTVQAWMASPLHRKNILSADFTDTCVTSEQGLYQGQMENYIEQVFASPLAPPAVSATSTSRAITLSVATSSEHIILPRDASIQASSASSGDTGVSDGISSSQRFTEKLAVVFIIIFAVAFFYAVVFGSFK